MKNSLLLALCLLSNLAVSAETVQNCTLRLAGDSTMQDQDQTSKPEFGWGEVLPELVPAPVQVVNYAKGGRSTKTFILEQRWQNLLEDTRPGDWVLIQFGHNDAAYNKPERYTAPVDYEANLRRMVLDVRAKDAKPILITPVVRRQFDEEGKLRDVHGIYPSLVHKVSRDMDVPLIDLFELSSNYILSLGVLESIKLFVHIGPGVHACCPEGLIDNTHFTRPGALAVAGLVIDDIKLRGPAQLAACFTSASDSGS